MLNGLVEVPKCGDGTRLNDPHAESAPVNARTASIEARRLITAKSIASPRSRRTSSSTEESGVTRQLQDDDRLQVRLRLD